MAFSTNQVAAAAVAGVLFASGLVACSKPEDSVLEQSSQSQVSPESGAAVEEPAEGPSLLRVETGLPFDLFTRDGGVAQIPVTHAQEASVAVSGEDFEELGSTHGEGNLPAPMPRTLISETEAFGAAILGIEPGAESLEAIDFALGTISTEGQFAALEPAGQVQEIDGSNPEGLAFEPQHASSHAPWVVWREGSAGTKDSMPTLDFDDWRIMAWNQETGQVFEVASAFHLHGERFAPPATWDVSPSTDGTNVYFEALMPSGEDWENTILSTPLSEPGETTLLGHGISPVAKDGGVYWVTEGDEGRYRVVEDGEPLFEIGGDDWKIGRIAASDELLATTISSEEEAWILVWDVRSGEPAEAIETGSTWAEVSVSGAAFVWGNASAASDATMFHKDEDGVKKLWATQGLSAPLLFEGTLAVPEETADGGITWRFLRWKRG